MSEIHFIVEESAEGGYIARAVGVDIFMRRMICPVFTIKCAMPCAATSRQTKSRPSSAYTSRGKRRSPNVP